MGEFGNEGSVKVTKVEKAPDVFYGEWCRPLGDTLYLCWVHFYFSLSDNDLEVFDFFFVKLAFLGFQEKVVSCKFVEKVVDLPAVFFGIVGHGDYGIIHVNVEPPLGDFVQEDFVHHRLEGCW